MSPLINSFKRVFSMPSYLILAMAVAFAIFLVSIWLPSYELIRFILTSDIFSPDLKLKLMISTLGLIKSNFFIISRIIIISLSVLSGINLAMLIFYLKRKIILQRESGLGFIGILSGLLGVSCASCGSVILSALIGLSATASFMGILPFNGLEFGIFGVAILFLSIYLIAKKIQNPKVCKDSFII